MTTRDPLGDLIQAAQTVVTAGTSPSEAGSAHDLAEALPALADALRRLQSAASEVGFSDGRFGRILTAVFATTPDDANAFDMDADELEVLRELADGANELEGIHATVRSCVLDRYDIFDRGDLEKLLNLEHMLTDALVQLRHLNAWEPFDRSASPEMTR